MKFFDAAHRKDIQDSARTRLESWEEHLESPVAALAKALECLDAVDECCSLGSRIICPSLACLCQGRCPVQLVYRVCWEGMWSFLDPWVVARDSQRLECREEVRAALVSSSPSF